MQGWCNEVVTAGDFQVYNPNGTTPPAARKSGHARRWFVETVVCSEGTDQKCKTVIKPHLPPGSRPRCGAG